MTICLVVESSSAYVVCSQYTNVLCENLRFSERCPASSFRRSAPFAVVLIKDGQGRDTKVNCVVLVLVRVLKRGTGVENNESLSSQNSCASSCWYYRWG